MRTTKFILLRRELLTLIITDRIWVDLVTTTREDGVEIFDKFHVCFEALRTIWRAHCRPIFGIDGCFLKSSSAGQLLAVVGRDANSQIYPVA